MRAAILAATALGALRCVLQSDHSESGILSQVCNLAEVMGPHCKVIILTGEVWRMPVAVWVKSAQGGKSFGEDFGNHGKHRGRLGNNRTEGGGRFPPALGT